MSWLSKAVKKIARPKNYLAYATGGLSLLPGALGGKGGGSGGGYQGFNVNDLEKKAGIKRPDYESLRDENGNLKSQFKVDPYSSAALQELKSQAMAQGPSAWANLQTQQQKMEQQKALSDAQRMGMQASSQAQGQLARSGGLQGGASTLLARQAQRDLLNQGQNISGQGMAQRLGIQQQDLARKEGLLGQLGQIDIGAQQANVGQSTGDVTNKAQFDLAKYKEQMAAWGATQSANAQRAAAKGGSKK